MAQRNNNSLENDRRLIEAWQRGDPNPPVSGKHYKGHHYRPRDHRGRYRTAGAGFSDDEERYEGGGGGGRGRRRYDRERELTAAAVADLRAYDDDHDDGGMYEDDDDGNVMYDEEPLEEEEQPVFAGEDYDPDEEIPIKWKKVTLHFRAAPVKLSALRSAGVVVALANEYESNKAAQDILSSGAYLGTVRVEDLRIANSPVSWAVRAESHAGGRKEEMVDPVSGRSKYVKSSWNAIPLRTPTDLAPRVDGPVHGVMVKEALPNKTYSMTVRSRTPVYPTELSHYGGGKWNVSNLTDGRKEALAKGVDELDVNHPIAQMLIARGVVALPSDNPEDVISVHAPHVEVVKAEKELLKQESENPKINDVNSLQLVFLRAHGKARNNGGAPDWKDRTELSDDCSDTKSAGVLYSKRVNSPITITGKWVIEYGHPAPAPEFLEGDDADPVMAGAPLAYNDDSEDEGGAYMAGARGVLDDDFEERDDRSSGPYRL